MKILDINAKGTMLCVRAASQAMSNQEPLTIEGRYGSRSIGRGSIVNLGSALSYMAVPGALAYTASKHAVLGITKTAGKRAATKSLPLCANLALITRLGGESAG